MAIRRKENVEIKTCFTCKIGIFSGMVSDDLEIDVQDAKEQRCKLKNSDSIMYSIILHFHQQVLSDRNFSNVITVLVRKANNNIVVFILITIGGCDW